MLGRPRRAPAAHKDDERAAIRTRRQRPRIPPEENGRPRGCSGTLRRQTPKARRIVLTHHRSRSGTCRRGRALAAAPHLVGNGRSAGSTEVDRRGRVRIIPMYYEKPPNLRSAKLAGPDLAGVSLRRVLPAAPSWQGSGTSRPPSCRLPSLGPGVAARAAIPVQKPIAGVPRCVHHRAGRARERHSLGTGILARSLCHPRSGPPAFHRGNSNPGGVLQYLHRGILGEHAG